MFEPGVTTVEAEANVWFHGSIVDTQTWTWEVEIDAVPDGEEPEELEEAEEGEITEVNMDLVL